MFKGQPVHEDIRGGLWAVVVDCLTLEGGNYRPSRKLCKHHKKISCVKPRGAKTSASIQEKNPENFNRLMQLSLLLLICHLYLVINLCYGTCLVIFI